MSPLRDAGTTRSQRPKKNLLPPWISDGNPQSTAIATMKNCRPFQLGLRPNRRLNAENDNHIIETVTHVSKTAKTTAPLTC